VFPVIIVSRKYQSTIEKLKWGGVGKKNRGVVRNLAPTERSAYGDPKRGQICVAEHILKCLYQKTKNGAWYTVSTKGTCGAAARKFRIERATPQGG